MIKLVVFDWNGVLIADAAATAAANKAVFEAFGHTPLDLKSFRELFTIPVKDFYVAAGFSQEEVARDGDRMHEMFHALYEPRIAKIRTRTGARKLLEYLEANNVDAVIMSNHNIKGITDQLNRLGIKKYFSQLIVNDKQTTLERKNKAEKLVEFVRNSSHAKEEILIVGDSVEEIEAARAAGIKVVAITGGYYSTKRLKEAKPDYLIHKLPDMIDIIKKV